MNTPSGRRKKGKLGVLVKMVTVVTVVMSVMANVSMEMVVYFNWQVLPTFLQELPSNSKVNLS